MSNRHPIYNIHHKAFYTLRTYTDDTETDGYVIIYNCNCGANIKARNNNVYKHKNTKRCLDYHNYFVNI